MPPTAPHQATSTSPNRGRRRERRRYHHGHLRDALIDAGIELARTGGPDAVVLRVASRQVGVSPTAAYRHFANQEDLVAAVAQQCMTKLTRSMIEGKRRITTGDPVERAPAVLEAIGRAYIDFARTEPGWFRTAFSSARPHPADRSDADSINAYARDTEPIPGPFELLQARLDEFVVAGVVPHERRAGAEYAAWSAVHGLSELLLDGPLRQLTEPEVEGVIAIVLATVCQALT